MGQQQLLLVILVTILVGIATVVAINVFGTAAEQANRDAVRQDLLAGAAGGQAAYIQPVALGGAGRNFGDFGDNNLARALGIPGAIVDNVVTNENAEYTVVADGPNTFEITAEPNNYQWTLTIGVERITADNVWVVTITDANPTVDPVVIDPRVQTPS
jgi:hypothetical protein